MAKPKEYLLEELELAVFNRDVRQFLFEQELEELLMRLRGLSNE